MAVNNIRSFLGAAAVFLAVALLPGCNKNVGTLVTADAPALEAAQKLPDGTNVLAALDKKDYEGAVAILARVQASITGDQAADFTFLKQHVKGKLAAASETDPKAAEALNSVRAMTIQR